MSKEAGIKPPARFTLVPTQTRNTLESYSLNSTPTLNDMLFSTRCTNKLTLILLLAASVWQTAQANDRPLLRATRSGYELRAEAQPWTRALQTAKDTPNTLVFSVARNTEREQAYHWIGPVTTSEVWLFKLKSRTDIRLDTFEDLKPYTVGDVASSSTTNLLQKHGIKVDSAPSNVSNCRKFKAGRVDLIPFDPNGIKIFLHTCGLKPEDVERSLHLPRDTALYIALSKNSDPELVQQLQTQFQAIVKDKSLQRLHEQWKMPYKAPSI